MQLKLKAAYKTSTTEYNMKNCCNTNNIRIEYVTIQYISYQFRPNK